LKTNLVLALDGIQDPGNLGTIVRLADWFGIEHIFCSDDSADIYQPKAVQSTMGAIARVKVCYVNLFDFLSEKRGYRSMAPSSKGRTYIKLLSPVMVLL